MERDPQPSQPTILRDGNSNRELTSEVRAEIYAAKQKGVPTKDIAAQFGIHPNTVSRTVKRFQKHQTFDTLERKGRPEKLTPSDRRYLRLAAKKNPRVTFRELRSETNCAVSTSTLRRALEKDNVTRALVTPSVTSQSLPATGHPKKGGTREKGLRL